MVVNDFCPFCGKRPSELTVRLLLEPDSFKDFEREDISHLKTRLAEALLEILGLSELLSIEIALDGASEGAYHFTVQQGLKIFTLRK